MYNALVLGALLVSLLFDDLSGHSYPCTFFDFLLHKLEVHTLCIQHCNSCASETEVDGVY